MSVRVIEQRYCDMCEADFSDRPDWMILSAPNAPEGMEAQWDFCSYNCMVAWINDEVQEALPEEPAPEPALQVVPTQPEPEFRPTMTLADAIATGAFTPRR